ncbi:hypothetical protein WJX81_005201 [Elliptochloris bilobata]|uniref:C3H1-type domain-containing protein n=1 Tax=Elliptochloris bilobata TaxID=381761 RepID=A0AAW1RGU0_9CHLO
MEKKGRETAGLSCLSDAAYTSDNFRVWEFKVKRCPRSRPHDWTQCPFAHPSEKAKRRDPRRYKYSGTACPDFRKSGKCRRGDACQFAHGVFECWLHPARYRTQMCTDGLGCKRRVCFFAHHDGELRKVDEEGASASGKDAELLAEALAYQKQLLALASSLPAHGDVSCRLGEAQQRGPAGRRARAEPQQPPAADVGLGEQAQLLGMDGAALLQLVAANQAQVQQQAEAELAQRVNAEVQRRSFDARRSLDGFRPARASLDLPRAASSCLDSLYGTGPPVSAPYGVDYGSPPSSNVLSSGAYGASAFGAGGGSGGQGMGSADGSLDALMACGGAAAARAAAAAFSQRRFSVDGVLDARGGIAHLGSCSQAYGAALAQAPPQYMLPANATSHAHCTNPNPPHAPSHGHRRSVDMGALARAGFGGGAGCGGLDLAGLHLLGHATSSHTSSASSESSESFAPPVCGGSSTIPEGAQWLCGTGGALGNGESLAEAYPGAKIGAKFGAFTMAAGRTPAGEFIVRNASFDSIFADMPRSISELILTEQMVCHRASATSSVNGEL